MTAVRTAAKRRQAERLHYFTVAQYATLSRDTGISVDVLRTFAGISDPRSAHRFTVAAFHTRGERAWRQYKHDGIARPAAEVFDDLDALVDRITASNRHPPLLEDAS